MPDRERKRVPGYWSDILKGSLGSSRVHWQCGNHTEMPNTRVGCAVVSVGTLAQYWATDASVRKGLIGFVRKTDIF